MQLSGIFVYPIKACAGISLTRADVAARGLAGDRRYMLVDHDGLAVTQREQPRLCLVETALSADRVDVSAPGQPTLSLPRELEEAAYESRAYRLWGDSGRALVHPPGSGWFSQFLGDQLSLVYMPDGERRPVNPARARPGDIVSFADAYPLLLLSEASLADLNRRLTAPLEMRRFRPNLVISGAEPYAEDSFESLSIGGVSFRAVKRCERCVVANVDPSTAERGREPLRTLARYRSQEGKIWFGMNLVHEGSGSLELGDPVYGQ